MFGIGLGEIIIIIFVAFLINPREIPKMMRKMANFFSALRQMKEELMEMQDDVEEVLKDGKIEIRALNEDLQRGWGVKYTNRRTREHKEREEAARTKSRKAAENTEARREEPEI